MDEILNAAIAKYVDEKGGFEFYRKRVNKGKSFVGNDGEVVLIKQGSNEILARYALDEIGLSPEIVNRETEVSRESPNTIENIISGKDPRSRLGMASSIIVAIGCFSPLVTLPVIGSINYLYNGRGDGILVLIASIVALSLASTARMKSLPYIGGGISLLTFFTLWSFQIRLMNIGARIESELEGNPFRGLADAAISSIGLGWGWFVLLAGCIGLIASGYSDVLCGRISLPEYCIIPRKGKWKYNIPLTMLAACFAGFVVAAIVNSYYAVTGNTW